jgi:hypothetical protein
MNRVSQIKGRTIVERIGTVVSGHFLVQAYPSKIAYVFHGLEFTNRGINGAYTRLDTGDYQGGGFISWEQIISIERMTY